MCSQVGVAAAPIGAGVGALPRTRRRARSGNGSDRNGRRRRLPVKSGRDQLARVPRGRLQLRVPELLRECFAVARAVVVDVVVVVVADGRELVLDVAHVERPAPFDVDAGNQG